MSSINELIAALQNGRFDAAFTTLYGADAIAHQRLRYQKAAEAYAELYDKNDDVCFFSAPGRTEIGGNHTDHNHGCVVAGSENLDVIAVAAKSNEPTIRIKSAGYKADVIDLNDLQVRQDEYNRSSALVRGVADRFCQLGYTVGGVRAYTTSEVLKGSGLSSSAAFEVLIGTVLSHLYNGGVVDAVKIAQIAQYAENVHFGKPCGLMDQMASSVGGIISIDFADTDAPIVEKVDYDFAASGHRLCIVDTAGNHAALTHEYAAVTDEMKRISTAMGVNYLRETSYEAVLANLPELRKACGDRAVLRALHFFADNDRVAKEVAALKENDFEAFLKLVTESGHSSFEYLQNIYSNTSVHFQGLSVALAVAQRVLGGRGAYRVHGGGFGGTTQNFVPEDLVQEFTETLESVFGKGNCHILSIRPCGGVQVLPN